MTVHNGLGAGMDVDMLDPHCLFALPPEFRESFDLRRVGARSLTA
jgi:hypothetical protein